jgi:transmembrane sensor
MNDDRWLTLGKKIDPDWDATRARAARLEIEQRVAKAPSRARAVAAGGAFVLLVAVGGALALRTLLRRAEAPPTTASADTVAPVTVTDLVPQTVLEPIPERRGRGFVLRSGGARFAAPHDAQHPFVVVAGDVVIEDLGTTFTVQYLPEDKLEVAVEQGRVAVQAFGADTELAAGERLEIPLSPPSASPPTVVPESLRGSIAAWRPLAEKGRYDEAHTALRKAGPSAVRDQTADLLLAADAARLSGYPAEAVPYLDRVVHAHAGDPRAGLAAFTLGRVLLDELGRPREAIDAFARARAAGGPLAEDALAREVEASSQAGDITKSRELARAYRHLYPNGQRTKAVLRFGGLD